MINRIGQLMIRAKWISHEKSLLILFKKLLLALRYYLFSYSSFDIYESVLDPPHMTCKVDNLTIRVITRPEEIAPLESDQLIAESINISRDKEVLCMGAILFCAFVGNELAHVTQVFIGRRAHEIYPLSFTMQYGHTVGLAGFTAPKYRRKGLYVYTRSNALQYLKENGFSRAWDVQNGSIAARNAVLKLGYYFWGKGYRLRLLSLFTIEWTKPKSQLASRRIHCSLNRK
jgi:GNAT superfamily N-acetyltransferase